MRVEAKAHLDKATQYLAKARFHIAAAASEPLMIEDAARDAYYVAFHAAQALTMERVGKASKTHAGVHRQFHRLTVNEASITEAMRAFINTAHDFKTIADYDVASTGKITVARATTAIGMAEQILVAITAAAVTHAG